jgi:hypothetical protein
MRWRVRSAALDVMVRDLGAEATPFLHTSRWFTLGAGLSVMAQCRLHFHWNLDLTPWERDLRVLWIDKTQ